MHRKIIVLLLVVLVGMGLLILSFPGRPGGTVGQSLSPLPQPVQVGPLVKLDAVPKVLDDMFGFSASDVKPYNIKEADFPDGFKQYMVSYGTGHLRENYSAIKTELTEKYGFILQYEHIDADQLFTLDFKRNDERLLVGGTKAGYTKPNFGVVTITFYAQI